MAHLSRAPVHRASAALHQFENGMGRSIVRRNQANESCEVRQETRVIQRMKAERKLAHAIRGTTNAYAEMRELVTMFTQRIAVSS